MNTREPDLEQLRKAWQTDVEHREEIERTAHKIANEDKYIKDMREALVKAHREGDVDEIKDIHEIMKDKEGM